MSGGLMQLVAYGAQDVYLTGNPQMTFFKVVYKRHTNFSIESIQQVLEGNNNFGGDVVSTISRNGDLLYKMYLEHNAKFKGWVNHEESQAVKIGVVSNYGSNLMKKMELEIGGQLIDRQYGHFHSAYSELTQFNPTGNWATLYNRMSGNGIGHSTEAIIGLKGTNASATIAGWTNTNAGTASSGQPPEMEGRFFIPFYFWFCKDPGLALPLISLQYHEVKVKISYENIINLMGEDDGGIWDTGSTTKPGISGNNNGSTFDLWCDYIYLDTDERRRFAQVSHEYLIEQVQHILIDEEEAFTAKISLNHPIKELIWKNEHHPFFTPSDPDDIHGGHNQTDHTKYLCAPFVINGDYQLKLNGHDRFSKRDYKYFTRTQVWQHHTGYGGYIGQTQDENGHGLGIEARDTIAVYSFALKPEEHQPSGTCNFSRIDSVEFIRSGTNLNKLHGGLNIYAINYNVLRIMSGMGGLAYSN